MIERRAIAVEGIVQGVGFRPFVYSLASRLNLRGFVKNRTGGVWIEVEGEGPSLDRFLSELSSRPPPLAQIQHLDWTRAAPAGEQQFRIDASEADAGPIFVGPDVATCDACLAELFDPADRRHGYPFLNCTHCGPRLTIITGAPYDRAQTTMAGFPMCDACRAEYDDPANRRFHAQPTACARCGPSLAFHGPDGARREVAQPLTAFAAALAEGLIGALKGLGGYHLVCDAANARAVVELRRRKHRDEKPFAIMVRDLDGAEQLCEVSPGERDLLQSPRRPIVLLRKKPAARITAEVAPRNPFLGVMLAYTPLHHLLLAALQDRPLVMTSGNRSDEPIAYEEADALARLHGIADCFLTHTRPIHVRCDDSVTRVGQVANLPDPRDLQAIIPLPNPTECGDRYPRRSGRLATCPTRGEDPHAEREDYDEMPIRRSRGYAPQPIRLPFDCPESILAVGGQLKATFALGRGGHAFLSHHLGDLDNYDAFRAFVKDVGLYEQLFGVCPTIIAHDLHPDYASTRYAQDRAGPAKPGTGAIGTTIATTPVQHHHAHVASCMAEHGLDEPVIGVAFDGTGFGTDGAVWGGEFLVADYRTFRRASYFRYVGMAGGEQAIREPWRMAFVQLQDSGLPANDFLGRIAAPARQVVSQMLARTLRTPLTSSVGRLFDAVAAIAGVRDKVSYEGQAAMELEWLATPVPPDGAYPFELTTASGPASPTMEVDVRPLIRAVVEDLKAATPAAQVARRFHSTLVDVIAAVCGRVRKDCGIDAVVLSGGVFLNHLLTREATARLAGDGFRVYRHCRVPPGDGGLSLGQVAIAAARRRAGDF